MILYSYRENLIQSQTVFFKEDIIMSETLNRVAAFGGENGACGTSDPAPSACGAADPKPSSCGSACGAADPDKK
jgi:hypothetical protein